ncbi:MAG TPA: phosphate ABC transporter substrate-binding protein [bacterium]|nr:phosphate ABC transporter substrate-binding protein [bacterium]
MKKRIYLALASLMAFSASVYAQGMIQIKGSDTSVNLVQRLAEVYMEKDPNTAIAVTGGGSGVGIAALIANKVDVADASRPMKDKEYAAAKENGVVATEIAIGIDALSVVVNAANPIQSLSMAQAGAIFRGEVANWKELGGPDMPISLYGRQPSSGTYVFFQEHVMGNKNYSPKMKQMNGNAQIIEAVAADKAGISYVGVGYVYDDKGQIHSSIKVLDISTGSGKAISPLEREKIKSGAYPIARALYQYTNGKPKGNLKNFITFILSPEGQKVVEEMGFYPVSGKYLENNKKAGF